MFKPFIDLLITGKWRGIQRMCGLSVCNSTQLLTADRLNMLDQVVVTMERFISQSHLDGNNLWPITILQFNKLKVGVQFSF
jgi:hypothetical protein